MRSNKRNRLLAVTLALLFLLCVPLSISAQNTPAQWTVFLYLCGSDLESNSSEATLNLESLLSAPPSDKVNYVIQTGGAKEWHTEGINADKIERFIADNGELSKVDSLPLASMGRPETLGSFLSWGVQAYPAEKYMAILWDHGGGPLGGAICDELFDYDHMSVPELAEGIAQAGVKFELIGFDACLMGSLEIASMLAPYSNYFIASEELEPGSGWDYERLAKFLAENPESNGVYLGKRICDSFKWSNDSSILLPNSHTLSVIDLSKIAPLSEALGDLIREWGELIPDIADYQALIHDLSGTEQYSSGATIDIGDMLLRAESSDPLSTQKVRIALNEAVVYSVHGSSRSSSYGLSFVYKQGLDAKLLDAYAMICPMPEYLAYLDALNSEWIAPDQVYSQTEQVPEPDDELYRVAFETHENNDGQWELQITHGVDAVQMVTYSLMSLEDDGISFGTSSEVGDDWDNGVFIDGFDGTWPAFGDQFCYMEQLYDQGEFALFNIPVKVEEVIDEEDEDAEESEASEAQELNLRAAYWYGEDGEPGYFELFGIGDYSSSASNLPNQDVIPLSEGMIITPLYVDLNDEDNGYIEGDPIEYQEGVTILEQRDLPDGEYWIKFEIKDVLGQVQYSELLGEEIVDGIVQ